MSRKKSALISSIDIGDLGASDLWLFAPALHDPKSTHVPLR
jgi:hypothetical protein